ncbi:MAG: hypothetical protein Q8K55_09835 [Gemmatimonadaceae bacterium]|nr:hypothetical protein [Gemmatimonadaceae bacterium]
MRYPTNATAHHAAQSTPRVRSFWSVPRLARMGTVAALTQRVDNRGKNDGGKYPNRRT